jgi:hypothetical protein
MKRYAQKRDVVKQHDAQYTLCTLWKLLMKIAERTLNHVHQNARTHHLKGRAGWFTSAKECKISLSSARTIGLLTSIGSLVLWEIKLRPLHAVTAAGPPSPAASCANDRPRRVLLLRRADPQQRIGRAWAACNNKQARVQTLDTADRLMSHNHLSPRRLHVPPPLANFLSTAAGEITGGAFVALCACCWLALQRCKMRAWQWPWFAGED